MFFFICLLRILVICFAGDRYVYYDLEASYINASPLGVSQQVIAINKQFPGPYVIATTNWNLVINVHNNLDEPFLLTWNGLQNRKNSWQDGVLGTNCPILPGQNWTYRFQVKDQVGSFFYFPSTQFQRAAGGYGGIIINNRPVIPIPFGTPDGDITLFISDWYTRSHKELRKSLDDGSDIGIPDGVLFNGFGPYRYGTSTTTGSSHLRANVEAGKTYRIRVHHVGISTSLNFRIQNHKLLLVETEGSYTVQTTFTSIDFHVGQSYSFLVTMDQDASIDYYMVASACYVNGSTWDRVKGVAILHYSTSQSSASSLLPDSPDSTDISFSMNQARSIRWNLSASGARPNPQGSFKYGTIPVTDVYVLLNKAPEVINGKSRATLNGISYFAPNISLKLAQQYNIPGVYKLDFPNRFMNRAAKLDTSIINATYKSFTEIVFQNSDSAIQSYHLDGYAFFVVGMDFGQWTENSRGAYNRLDGVARCTVQVFPGAWTAVLVFLDNVGIWNLRSQDLKAWYLGQETYISVSNPEEKTEVSLPDNTIYCGLLKGIGK